jgi:hypothetical protein
MIAINVDINVERAALGYIRAKFYVNIGRDGYEEGSATWNLDTNSAFAPGPRKLMENCDRVGKTIF